ncbi:MAG: ABC transporter ATP-binding protein, partial [Candidatus Asgardarchaeia archaeon]
MVDVEFINVTKKYGDVIAIKNISFKIEDGEYVVLCGPTGAGKTTLLYLIAGLVKPDSGEILFNGQPINDVPPEERSVGFMFETFALFPHLNVMKNVTYGPWVRGVLSGDTIASAKEILELMHLAGWENAYPHELSGGMKQRVALARALVAEAKVLLLDEPFGALDAKIKMELRYEMRKLADSLKFTAVHATH